MFREVRTLLILFLCLSVLLSGCITANTAIFKPEPDSNGDWVARALGGFGDVVFITSLLVAGGHPGYKNPASSSLLTIGSIIVDVIIRNTLSYRKADYQEKEAEEAATESEEESSEQSP